MYKRQVYDLYLLDKVTDSQGQTQKTYETVVKSEMTDVPSHVWEDIHDGMRRVVQTHEQFNGLGVALSGNCLLYTSLQAFFRTGLYDF